MLLRIDWKTLLLGGEDFSFLPEVAVRSVLMFLVILIALRILGKRSISQLSVFELGVIIGLGSAAGDPMFYKDVGLLPALVVFAVIVTLSRAITALINSGEKAERLLEGEPVYLVENGVLLLRQFKKEPVAQNELFAQLRLQSVSHLGQVERAVLETNGNLSVFYFSDDAVRPGMPILPHLCAQPLKEITDNETYACGRCSKVAVPQNNTCAHCGANQWLRPLNTKRIR